jgi:hypothetical protein
LEYEVGLLVNSGNEGLRIVVQSVVRWLAAGQVVVVMRVVVVKRVARGILAVGDVDRDEFPYSEGFVEFVEGGFVILRLPFERKKIAMRV